jgi:hypothetical protein
MRGKALILPARLQPSHELNDFGHWNNTTFACNAQATASVRSHASQACSAGLKDPTRSASDSLNRDFNRRYAGLFGAWVMSCHALTQNWNSGGASALRAIRNTR